MQNSLVLAILAEKAVKRIEHTDVKKRRHHITACKI
jgi:hypothetical protein